MQYHLSVLFFKINNYYLLYCYNSYFVILRPIFQLIIVDSF